MERLGALALAASWVLNVSLSEVWRTGDSTAVIGTQEG